jgi:glycosyltransferase involved in cell wall biosynthesis
VVSRFPELSQTFVVRELNAVSGGGDGAARVDVELCSLFPPIDPTLHPAATDWLPGLHRPTIVDGGRAVAWWLRRRPLRLLGALGIVAAEHLGRPRVLGRALATLPLAAAHARTLRDSGVDRVHAHFASYPTLTAWLILRLAGLPYSFTAHAHDLFTHQSFLPRKVREADFVVSISEFNRNFLIDQCGDQGTPIHVVHCGVDSRRYGGGQRVRRPDGQLVAVCVARLEEKKGHAVLIEALAGGGPGLERVHLDLIGDGELRQELERQVERLGLRDRVRFHGSIPEEEVSAALERADLFVLPSVRTAGGEMEGIPVSLMEALATGLPAVATRLSGIPELVRDGLTGVLAEPGSVDELRAALRRIVDDPEGAARMGAEGRRLVEREFDIRVSGERMVELFRAPAATHR